MHRDHSRSSFVDSSHSLQQVTPIRCDADALLLCLPLLQGGAELAYQYAFHLKDRRDASVVQHLSASVLGSVASIIVSSPLDTIKTRIQMQNFGTNTSGTAVFKELIRHEGITALWKGLTPKILIVGPKLGQTKKSERTQGRGGSARLHSCIVSRLLTRCRCSCLCFPLLLQCSR
jgi:hypothetical protein